MQSGTKKGDCCFDSGQPEDWPLVDQVRRRKSEGKPLLPYLEILSSSSTLLQCDMGRAFALDTLYTFIAQRGQIHSTKQVLPIPQEKWHDCQM